MAKWNLPPAQTKKKFEIETFKGNDFTNEPANVKSYRSPNAVNMVRESVGKVQKRTGFHTVKTYPDRINGVHYLTYTENGAVKQKKFIHAGTKIYMDGGTDDYTVDPVLYSDANDTISASLQVGKQLIIFDGKKTLVVKEDFSLVTLESVAYVPTILIARSPTGGGTQLEPINLLSPKRTERFAGVASTTVYQLSATSLDATTVEVKKLNSSGGFDTLTETTDFTVNRTTGAITFTTAPGVSPVTGEDNIYITYAKTVSGYADKINKCDVIAMYGVNGSRDRLFCSGNADRANEVFYSQLNNPAFFGDLWYLQLGQNDSHIMGFSIINNYLSVHKDYSPDQTNIVLIDGKLVDGKAAFLQANAYQGTGAVSKRTFGVLETEPMYLTKEGIFAVTPSDVLGERYAQDRSYYLNGKLLKEPNLENAYAITWKRFYVLAINGHLYLLDGMQASYNQKEEPYSSRQYEGYYWTGIPARVLYTENGNLCFGDSDGNICEFYTDYNSLFSFNDNGKAVYACWETEEFYGENFYKDKNFTKFAVLLASAIATGCRVWAIYDGTEELILDYTGDARYFSYSQFVYSKFTYKTDRTPQQIIEKIRIKKVDKIRFRIENGLLNEPVGLYNMVSEYTERKI